MARIFDVIQAPDQGLNQMVPACPRPAAATSASARR